MATTPQCCVVAETRWRLPVPIRGSAGALEPQRLPTAGPAPAILPRIRAQFGHLTGDSMASLRLVVPGCLMVCAVTACRQKAPADEHMDHMAAGDLSAPLVANSTSQGDLSLPASDQHAVARLAASPRHSEWVKIPWHHGSSDSLMAWVVYPSDVESTYAGRRRRARDLRPVDVGARRGRPGRRRRVHRHRA